MHYSCEQTNARLIPTEAGVSYNQRWKKEDCSLVRPVEKDLTKKRRSRLSEVSKYTRQPTS